MTYDKDGRPAPTELRLKTAERALEIYFENGMAFSLPAEFLRVESPSAEVKGHGPGQRVIVAGKRNVSIKRIEPVGNYAVRLVFDDGHDTGIYSWEFLYEIGGKQDQMWRAYVNELAVRGLKREP